MSRPSPTQPLSQDLRNQSFREVNCEEWDFSGRDIRGCDFKNTKLNSANFSKAITGRSEKQITNDIILTIAVAVAVAGLMDRLCLRVGRGVGRVKFANG